jgi:hypothetical protein
MKAKGELDVDERGEMCEMSERGEIERIGGDRGSGDD